MTAFHNKDLLQRIESLNNSLKEKEHEIDKLKESQVSLADANVRIAELYIELEDSLTLLEEQREDLSIKNTELENTTEELRQISDQLTESQRLSDALNNVHEQSVQIAQKNKKILESINYARKIQQAIIPSQDNLRNIFHHSFIFSQPKDIVGGDFVWTVWHRHYKFLIVGDCTGH